MSRMEKSERRSALLEQIGLQRRMWRAAATVPALAQGIDHGLPRSGVIYRRLHLLHELITVVIVSPTFALMQLDEIGAALLSQRVQLANKPRRHAGRNLMGHPGGP